MKHSPTIVSDILQDLIDVDAEIDNLLLIGQQIELIETAGGLYNHLRSLVTDPYLTATEYDWVCTVGTKWNTMEGLLMLVGCVRTYLWEWCEQCHTKRDSYSYRPLAI